MFWPWKGHIGAIGCTSNVNHGTILCPCYWLMALQIQHLEWLKNMSDSKKKAEYGIFQWLNITQTDEKLVEVTNIVKINYNPCKRWKNLKYFLKDKQNRLFILYRLLNNTYYHMLSYFIYKHLSQNINYLWEAFI